MSNNPSDPGTFRRRVVIAFGLFSFVLSTLFGVLIGGAILMSEDLILVRTMGLELEDYLERRAMDPDTPLPSSRWLGSSLGSEGLPPPLKRFADLPDGAHEIGSLFGVEPYLDEVFLLNHTLDDGRRLYFYMDSEKVEVLGKSSRLLGLFLLGGVIVVTGAGLTLGSLTARRVIAPVIELADRVRRADEPGGKPLNSTGFADDEIGLLARAFESSAARSRAFLDRERRFTRNASHELRSPVTVIRGAVELLEQLPEAEAPSIRRPLGRIRRAIDDMSRLIRAFLWLAREEDLSEGSAPRSLRDEASEAMSRHAHLLDGKDVELRLEIDPEAEVLAPEGVLSIILGNLLANACFFTSQGQILVRGDAVRLDVDDTGPGIPEELRQNMLDAHHQGRDSQGFGLGLAIVHDLCERFGWRLELGETPGGQGTRASVIFEDRPRPSKDLVTHKIL